MTSATDCLVALAEALIEKSLSRLMGEEFSPASVARALAQEVADGSRLDDKAQAYAPDQYTLSMNPLDIEVLFGVAPIIQTELSEGMRQALIACGYQLVREPHVTLATDPTIPRHQVRVIAWHSSDPLQFTKEMRTLPAGEADEPPPGAFVIVEGTRHFPLEKPVINVGRRLDNHLVLDDPHVSRRHAQLRVQGGRYVVVDLGSTAGTRVNGKPVEEHMLRPGDVITLAEVDLIYGEDPGGPPDVTPPYAPPFQRPEDRDQVTPLHLRRPSDLPRPPREGEDEPDSRS